MLLYRMATHPVRAVLSRKGININLKISNKHEEKKSGADWEWILLVRDPHCFLHMRLQAKRLYHKDKGNDYDALRSNIDQSSRLIEGAKARTSCIPLYIFYNHGFGESSNLFYETGKNTLNFTPSDWGCSVVNAENIIGIHELRKKINKVVNLIDYMKPLHFLIADCGDCNATSTLGVSSIFGGADRPIITDGQIPDDLQRLIENFDNHIYMSEYIENHELAGVAVFKVCKILG